MHFCLRAINLFAICHAYSNLPDLKKEKVPYLSEHRTSTRVTLYPGVATASRADMGLKRAGEGVELVEEVHDHAAKAHRGPVLRSSGRATAEGSQSSALRSPRVERRT